MKAFHLMGLALLLSVTMAGSALAADIAAPAKNQSAIVSKTLGDKTFHSFVGPAEKARFANHVIESKDSLLVLNLMQPAEEAKEFHAYVASLKKPVGAILLTRGGARNWGLLAMYPDVPVYATKFTQGQMMKKAPADNKREIKLLPDGKSTLAGVAVDVTHPLDGKCNDAEVIKFPDSKVAAIQGLGCVGVHMPMARHTDRNQALNNLITEDIVWIMPMNGLPGGEEVLIAAAEYNYTVGQALKAAQSPAEVKAILMEAFPDWAGEQALDELAPAVFATVQNSK